MIYKRGDDYHFDATIAGVRYREALHTADRREAIRLEKTRTAEILAGKGASKVGREFARTPFGEAADLFIEERKPHISERTNQLDRERLKPLRAFFGETPLLRIKASDISAYQRARLSGEISFTSGSKKPRGVGNRTINMEVTILRQMMRRAKVWSVVAEDVKMLPERQSIVGRVLTREQKALLFQTAGSREVWLVAHCAAVLAASTTCRGVELKNLRWKDVDLFARVLTVRRSKTDAGQRSIPLNDDAVAALVRLLERARAYHATDAEHFVFPACENEVIVPDRPQKTWRTAWRSLVKQSALRAGREVARALLATGSGLGVAKTAWRRAAAPFRGLRFHDLRHQAITELAERGASDATVMSLAGHLSRTMLEHYSHVRMAAKREAVEGLSSGLLHVTKQKDLPGTNRVQ
jgi:integrase